MQQADIIPIWNGSSYEYHSQESLRKYYKNLDNIFWRIGRVPFHFACGIKFKIPLCCILQFCLVQVLWQRPAADCLLYKNAVCNANGELPCILHRFFRQKRILSL